VYLIQTFSLQYGIYAVLYAGKTADLLARLTQHLQSATTAPEVQIARRKQRLFFSAAPVLDDVLRTGIEAGLIVRFRPPFNRQIPTAAPVLASLPPLRPPSIGALKRLCRGELT
jgi:hypothetical protein